MDCPRSAPLSLKVPRFIRLFPLSASVRPDDFGNATQGKREGYDGGHVSPQAVLIHQSSPAREDPGQPNIDGHPDRVAAKMRPGSSSD